MRWLFIRIFAHRSVLKLEAVVRYNFNSKMYFPARLERNKVQGQ